MVASIRARGGGVTGVGSTIFAPLPFKLSGDHIYVFVYAYGAFADTTAACSEWTVPEDWTLSLDQPLTESSTVVGRFAVFTRIVRPPFIALTMFEVTNPCNATAKQGGGIAMVWRDVGGSPGMDIVSDGPFNGADEPLPAVDVPVDDTVVMHVVWSVGRMINNFDPITGYADAFSSTSGTLHGDEIRFYVTAPRDTDMPAATHTMDVPVSVSTGAGTPYTVIGLAFVPAVLAIPPVGDQDLRPLRLGCADDYRVFVTAGDYATVIDSIGWSDLEWSRVLDQSSTATVTVPDRYGGLACCARLGGLLPWRFGIRIERDDRLVWNGAVTNVQRAPEALRVSCSDVMARFQKRLATRGEDLPFVNADAGNAFARIILESQELVAPEQWSLQPPEVTTGFAFTRTVLVRDFELAWDILQELAEAAVDFWVGNGVLYIFQPGTGWMYWDGFADVRLDGPYTATGELFYGTFTESAFVGLPQWSVNGWAQTNTGWVPGPDVGESGARRYWTARNPLSVYNDGVLDGVETFNLYRPEEEEDIPNDVFQAFADSLVDQRGAAPPIMEGAMLAESAPVDVDHLRPGSIWQLDIFDACYGQLLQLARLKRVTVRATKSSEGVTETVEPVLFPLGHEEGT